MIKSAFNELIDYTFRFCYWTIWYFDLVAMRKSPILKWKLHFLAKMFDELRKRDMSNASYLLDNAEDGFQ